MFDFERSILNFKKQNKINESIDLTQIMHKHYIFKFSLHVKLMLVLVYSTYSGKKTLTLRIRKKALFIINC